MGSHGIGLHLYLDGMENPEIDWSLAYVREFRPRWMNVTAFARHDQAQDLITRIRQASPTTRTIWRGGPREVFPDEQLWDKVSPERWFELRVVPYIEWLKQTQTAVLTSNESGWSLRWAQNEARAAELAHSVGVTAAVMRASTGSPGENDYDAMADELRRIGMTRAIISPNEYTAKAVIDRGGHVHRYSNYWRVQDKMQVPRSEIVIGEYAPVKFINGQPKPHDGWQNDGISIQDYVKIMVADTVWYQNVPRLLYCVGRWENGSFNLNKDFVPAMRGIDFSLTNLVQPPIAPPTFTASSEFQLVTAVVPIGTRVNVRAMPSTQSRSAVVGQVVNGTRCWVMKPPVSPTNWFVVLLPDLKIGYIRSDVISWRKE
jgi:hypothetical protein